MYIYIVVVIIIHSGSSPCTGASISHVLQTVYMRSTEQRKHSVAGKQLYNNNIRLHFLQDFARGVPDRKHRLRDDCRCVMRTILPQRCNTRYVTAVGFYFFRRSWYRNVLCRCNIGRKPTDKSSLTFTDTLVLIHHLYLQQYKRGAHRVNIIIQCVLLGLK